MDDVEDEEEVEVAMLLVANCLVFRQFCDKSAFRWFCKSIEIR